MKYIAADACPEVPASHEDPARPGVWKRVLATADDICSGQVMMVNRARLPIGASFRPHYHEDMQEIFVMIGGTARMRINESVVDLTAGDTVIVDALEVHDMQNTGTADVDYLVVGVSRQQGGRTIVV